ncbi:MAG: hypothetical protein LBI34_02785 [Puniceicoccales bacterium]|nr:hypothetical protein [Puniceicoccales bacterium]
MLASGEIDISTAIATILEDFRFLEASAATPACFSWLRAVCVITNDKLPGDDIACTTGYVFCIYVLLGCENNFCMYDVKTISAILLMADAGDITSLNLAWKIIPTHLKSGIVNIFFQYCMDMFCRHTCYGDEIRERVLEMREQLGPERSFFQKSNLLALCLMLAKAIHFLCAVHTAMKRG